MTDEPNSPATSPPGGPNPRTIWLGAATGIAPALAGALFIKNEPGVLSQPSAVLFIASVSLWPLAAVVLACNRTTRRFGLGMLLGVGLGWLTMLAICGGTLAR